MLCFSAAFAVNEHELSSQFNEKIIKFFQRGFDSYFYNQKGLPREIHYRIFRNSRTNKVIFISPGRGESQWLYAEMIFDLFQSGYSVAIIDHAGQGQSHRENFANRELQHVESFDEYAQDFNHFLRVVRDREFSQSEFKFGLLAHSAGAVISLAAQFREDNPIKFDAMVLSAPMLKINTSPAPHFVAEPTTALLSLVMGDSIAPFQKAKLDRDYLRYTDSKGQRRRDLLRKLHYEKVGRRGLYPSVRWALEAFRASRQLRGKKLPASVPTLVLVAEKDLVVIPSASAKVAKIIGESCEVSLVKNSSHDIWTESDLRRSEGMAKMLQHFDNHLK